MAWRKWLVRGLSFSALGAILLGVAAYQVWTNPAATRALVLDKLTARFRGANVRLEGAQMRLLGGIAVHELRMSRRESLDPDFLCVPSAVIYHDKEQLLNGVLAIRKIELFRPTLRLVRERDGSINLAGVCEKPDLNERMPTIVIKEGTVIVEDRAVADGVTVVELKDVNLTVINDPLPTLVLDGTSQVDVAGPVRFNARVQRAGGECSATVDAPSIPVGPDLVQRLRAAAPEIADHLRQMRGHGKVQAQLAYYPGSPYPLAYDLTAQLSGGEFAHARLPLPLDHVEAWLRLVNGKVPDAHLTARAGPARLEVSLKDLALPPHAPVSLDELVRECDAKVEHAPVSPDLFKPLPEKVQEFNTLYAPIGPLTLTYHFRREGPTGWRKRWVLQPEGMTGMFHLFRYPAERVTGSIVTELTSDHGHETTVDLKGFAADQPVTLKGTVGGAKKTGSIDLELVAHNIPLDERVLEALPEKSQLLARQFHPVGRGDVRAIIYRTPGQERLANRFTVVFHDCAVKYSLFPLPLEGVSGVLDIQPDHWECREFRGKYNGAEIAVEGFSYRPTAGPSRTATGVQTVGAPAEPPERIRLTIRGKGVALDKGFEQALDKAEVPCRPELQKAWNILRPGGQLSFAAEVDECPAQPQDIDVAVNLRGCELRPRFFDYALGGVSGRVRYVNNDRVRQGIFLSDFQAVHGPTAVGFHRGVVLLEGLNGLYTQLTGVKATALEVDDDLLHALPPVVRKGLDALKVRGPFDLTTSPDRPGLVVDTTKDPGNQPMIWWDGAVTFQDAAFQSGVSVTGVTGQASSVGKYNGQQLETVVGHVLLDRATVLGQPVQNFNARLEVLPREPDVLRLLDMKADLFGGSVGGSARVTYGPLVRYEVDLRALQVQLQQFGAHNKLGELQGPATAALYLEGTGSELSGLKGNGRIDVPSGKLLRLPPLLDLLKYFGLRQADRTAFEQARMVFAVEGPRLKVQQLELLGNAISLYGQGTLGLEGSDVNLDFTATPGRLTQVLPSVIDDLPRAISGQLLKVKMRGDLAKPRYEPEPVPAMTTSLRKVLGGVEK
jgi:hypothetical protein